MQSYNVETDWSRANDATQICIYKYKRRSKEKRQSWIWLDLRWNTGWISASPLELDRINISSWKRLIVSNVDWKVKKMNPRTLSRGELSRFIFDSVEILSQCCVVARWKFQDSVCVGYIAGSFRRWIFDMKWG